MCITKTQIPFSPTENILFLFFPSIIWIILITSFCCKCTVFKTCWLKQMLLGMVKELITDQKCLLSFAKVFIDSPSSTKWGAVGYCEDGWEIAVCFIILDSPLRPFLSVLVFTILINVAQMEDISPLPHKREAPKSIFCTCQVHSMPVEIIRISSKCTSAFTHSLGHSFNNHTHHAL